MKTQGEIEFPYQISPDRKIVERNDGTLEGTVEFTALKENELFLPEIDAEHPDDRRLEMHTREKTALTLGRVHMVGHFLGLTEDPTEPVISYVGSPDRERIESHDDFVDVLAGGPLAPKNESTWVDVYTGRPAADPKFAKFNGFGRNTVTGVVSPLLGVEYYLVPSTQVELTWWQTAVPDVKRMVIVDNIKPFKKPDDVADFLIVDTPYRQIGNHYQVTQIALGSGAGGWNQQIYPQANKK